MATNKPSLITAGRTIDCTGLLVKDNSVLEGGVTLPSFIVLQASLYGENEYSNIVINDVSLVTLTQFLERTPQILNSFTFGNTLVDDKLIELSCGVIKVNYHWFNNTNVTISYVKGRKEISGTFITIPDSVFIQGKIYTILKSKSTPLKLATSEVLEHTASSLLISGKFESYYFINDCAIVRGHIRALSALPVLDCEKVDCTVDKNQLDIELRSLMILKSAYIKLECGDVVNANQLIKKLCKQYADECSTKTSLVSDCEEKNDSYLSPCSNCS